MWLMTMLLAVHGGAATKDPWWREMITCLAAAVAAGFFIIFAVAIWLNT
jgi:hypothetical protein